jgi:hypothetical protein
VAPHSRREHGDLGDGCICQLPLCGKSERRIENDKQINKGREH